jgi:hypothetical protein
MKVSLNPARTAALLLTALLSSAIVPASAQRRPSSRQTTRPPAPARAAPRAETRAEPARAGVGNPPAATVARPPAATDSAADEPKERAGEAERTIEELLGADAYGAYVEVRKLATILYAPEIKTMLGGAALFDAQASEILQLANFVTENSETLADARVVLAVLPARTDLPQPLVAVQLPSPEAARLFEPKFRAFVTERRQALGALTEAPTRPARSRDGRRAGARRPRPAPAATRISTRRVGSWLLAADRPFTLRRLGGSAGPLADSARFQTLRARFANESVFVYVDTERTQQSWVMQMQQTREADDAARAAGGPALGADEESNDVLLRNDAEGPAMRGGVAQLGADPALTREKSSATVVEPILMPPSEGKSPAEGEAVQGEATALTPEVSVEIAGQPTPPTEAQLAGRHFNSLLSGLFGGVPRLPGAVAAGVSVEGGSVAMRVAVENAPGGPAGLIPFLPNVVAGPPVTVETSAAAPASNGILFATTLDWVQIFDSLMGSTAEDGGGAASPAVVTPEGATTEAGGGGAGLPAGAGDDKPLTAEARLAFVERLLGFKLRQDLLPTLGNEIAVSLPLELFTRLSSLRPRLEAEARGEEDRPAEPGMVGLVALNDPDRLRPLLPKLALLFRVAGGVPAYSEKRGEYEINSAGAFAYSIVDRFLLVSDEVSHLRHAVDSYARGETLAQTNAYRDSTAWQAPQRLAHAYVSPELMSGAVRETKRMAQGSEDPLVISTLPQLDLEPEAVTFAATDEGDFTVHELRLPVNLGRVYAATALIASREGENIGAEVMAAAALNSIYYAEMSYKGRKDRDRYGTLEELIAEGLVDDGFVRRDDYKIELTTIGDRFEVTATPRNYGKTGRRSFYLDQSGVVRAADHKGRPATADDPPVD